MPFVFFYSTNCTASKQGMGHKKCIPLGTKQNTICYRFLQLSSFSHNRTNFPQNLLISYCYLNEINTGCGRVRSCCLVTKGSCQLTLVLHLIDCWTVCVFLFFCVLFLYSSLYLIGQSEQGFYSIRLISGSYGVS